MKLTYFITANDSISSVAFKTGTTHCSCRGGRMNLARCMLNTRRNSCTRIYTSVFTTKKITHFKRRTINIYPTIWFFNYWFWY